MLKIYWYVSQWFAPSILTFLFKSRVREKKELAHRLEERKGIASERRPQGDLVWVHAASVGEAQLALNLIKLLSQHYTHYHFLITTGTVTSAHVVTQQLSPRTLHQFVPYDVPRWVDRFVEYWHPKAAIFMESELWPNIMRILAHKRVPFILLNGRLSDSSYGTWWWGRYFTDKIWSMISLCLAQSETHLDRFKALGVKNVEVLGNLKFASEMLSYSKISLCELQKWIGDRPFWLAASTHKGEEEVIFSTHRLLMQQYPDLLTIVVPRHPDRAEGIKNEAKFFGKVAQRSLNEAIDPSVGIYLADTLGEMGLFYRLTDIAFIGGSLRPDIGGHNLIEAAQLECALITGPYVENIQESVALFEKNKACFLVQNAHDIFRVIEKLWENTALLSQKKKIAYEVAHHQYDMRKKIIEILDSHLQDKII